MEYLLKNFLPLIGWCNEQFQKITLCNHCYLCELIAVYSHYLYDCLVNLVSVCNNPSVGEPELCAGFFDSHAFPSGFLSFVLGIALYAILFTGIFKQQFNLCRSFRFRILGTKHVCRSVVSACFPVKCVGNRIEDGCLSGARVPCNEI